MESRAVGQAKDVHGHWLTVQAGWHDNDGSETIKFVRYYEHKEYSNSGYQAFSIYKLKEPSKVTPVTLPDTKTPNLPDNTNVIT